MPTREQIAHDLALVYLANRFAVDVRGDFEVSTDSDGDTTGTGSVWTENLPHVSRHRTKRVGTGDRHLWGLGPEKKVTVDTDEYEIDDTFAEMIAEYRLAYERILALL